MEYKDTFIETGEQLNRLTADEIRTLMNDNKITGVVGESKACPIAVYYHQQAIAGTFTVGAYETYWHYGHVVNGRIKGQYHYVAHNYGVQEFVAMFDAGKYPELIQERA